MKDRQDRVAGRVAVVTGAGRGIGRVLAARLAGLGARTALVARTAGEIQSGAAAIRNAGGDAIAVAGDVTCEEDVHRIFADIEARLGPPDILVNNAGGGTYGPVSSFKADAFDEALRVNARSTFLCSREALRTMLVRKQGTIINISSVVGFRGYPNQAAYSAGKHAVMGLTKSLAREVYKDGIRVSAILPGGVDTEMIRRARPDLKPEDLLHPDDVAQAVEYLLSLSERAAVDEIYLRRRKSEPF